MNSSAIREHFLNKKLGSSYDRREKPSSAILYNHDASAEKTLLAKASYNGGGLPIGAIDLGALICTGVSEIRVFKIALFSLFPKCCIRA